MRFDGRDYFRLSMAGGGYPPGIAMSTEHVSLVMVFDTGEDIAKLRMSGILTRPEV